MFTERVCFTWTQFYEECKAAQAVTLLICIRDILGSNLTRDTEYPD
jgi:hypothetical protein